MDSQVFSPSTHLFQPFRKSRIELPLSLFIRPIHPKTEIKFTREAITKILNAGWVGQTKIEGHRAQIHISPNPTEKILVYNRQGRLHQKALSESLEKELRRVIAPKLDWCVVDAEWIKPQEKIYLFDLLKEEGVLLHSLSYVERWKKLPRDYLSPHLQTLGLFTTVEKCLEIMTLSKPEIEGLVFKSPSRGFEDSSIIRCRK